MNVQKSVNLQVTKTSFTTKGYINENTLSSTVAILIYDWARHKRF